MVLARWIGIEEAARRIIYSDAMPFGPPSCIGRDRLRHTAYNTGITSNVSTVDDTMPPIIGAAIRFITSAPVPVVHMMGSKPPIIAATVIILGRTR